MIFIYSIYLITIFYYSHKFSSKIANRFFHFWLFVWILGSPVLNSKYFVISIPGLFFDLHISRIFLLILIVLILNYNYMIRRHAIKREHILKLIEHKFEIWLILYIAVLLLSIFINVLGNHISLKFFFVMLINNLFFLILYFCLKIFSGFDLLEILKKTITRFSVLFSIIAIFQSFLIPGFFRFGETRLAFGEVVRANGIFFNEYTFAFFCITSAIILFLDNKNNYLAIGINFFATILTFHRLSIGIFLACFLIYIYHYKYRKEVHLFIYALCLLCLSSIFYSVVIKNYSLEKFTNTELYKHRLSSDTLSGRLDQYKNAIYIISNNLFGFGDYDTDRYIESADKIGQLYGKKVIDYENNKIIRIKLVGHIVHNSFLGAGVKYGIFGMITFFMFCLSATTHAFSIYKRLNDNNSVIFLSICISWFLYQTTQDFSNFSDYHNVFFGIILGVFSNYFSYSVKNNADAIS